MFRKRKQRPTQETNVAKERKAGLQRAEAEGAISIIGPGMRIVGDLNTEGSVRIEGTIEGTVRAGKAVVLAEAGRVKGEVRTADAVIGGIMEGVLTAESRLEIQGTSRIEGEVHARAQHIQIEEGARFNGRITMIEEGQAATKTLPASTERASDKQAAEVS